MKTNVISLLVTALIFIAISCKPQYQETTVSANSLAAVHVEAVSVKQDPLPIAVSGILASKAETRLSFKLGGIVRKFHVEEGQMVRKGQLLATLDLAEINAQVTQAQNAADKAIRDLNRVENLYRDSVATLEQVQDLKTLREIAQADLRIASFNQKYARITAPFAGKVLRRYTEQGELVNPGTPILTVGNHSANSYVMRISVADRDIVRLNLQDSARIHFDAYPQSSFKARVTELAEGADPHTGTFEVELTLLQAPEVFKNGFVGKAQIFPSNQPPYFQISMSALIEGDQQQATIFAFEPESQKARLVQLKPHHINDQYLTVLASTENNISHVIVEGGHYLEDGQKVQISPTN